MTKSIVLKFGGSCLSNPKDVLKAAKKVANEVNSGKRVMVVVSALTGMTDELLNASKKTDVRNDEMDEILSHGERATTRLMAGALKSLGVNAIDIDPTSKNWPIITDSKFGEAEIKLKETEKRVKKSILPLMRKGRVPVVPGFIGMTEKGKITTLGRGGSDITAVVLGSNIDADEVVFVKDVGGILTADPKQVSNTEKIDALDAEEVYALTLAGAKVLHPKVLSYKKNSTVLRVVGFDDKDLSGGTVINGELKTGLQTNLHGKELSMITLVGEEASNQKLGGEVLSTLSSTKAKVLGVVIEGSSLLLYVQSASGLVEQLHKMIRTKKIAKAIHCIDSIAMITVSGSQLEKIPGIVNVIIEPLAENGVNLFGVLTISSSVRLFIPWSDRERTLSLIKSKLEKT